MAMQSKVPSTPRHISIRVPWHDAGWDGTVCREPKLNGACLKLKRIALEKRDEAEHARAGLPLSQLEQKDWPCCVSERVAFMAPFEYTRVAAHPYGRSSPNTHAHFAPTPLRHPAYSAAAVPFAWMMKDKLEQYGQTYGIDVDPNREPELPFTTTWVQDRENHKALLDCFRAHLAPEKSLCFFYAKQVPFVDDAKGNRILVGVGRVSHVADCREYEYSCRDLTGKVRSMLWELMVQHTIRPEREDGFLLPYHDALRAAADDPSFDLAGVAAMTPEDRMDEFSYASELVTQDGAIGALLSCAASLRKVQGRIEGPWGRCLEWVDRRVGELWRLRGPCPGLGAVLSAFGLGLGTFVAREVAAKLNENEDPWPVVDAVFAEPKKHLSAETAAQFDTATCQKYARLHPERRALLKLLSRFEITPDQATRLYVQEERSAAGLPVTDAELLANPYLLYEATRATAEPISVWTVDRGVHPEAVVRRTHPLPEPSAVDSPTDPRRVRALSVYTLERAASQGNTLVPRDQAVLDIRQLDIQPACSVDRDLMAVVEDSFTPEIARAELADKSPAYQLMRLRAMGDVIRQSVKSRVAGKRHAISADWRERLDRHLDKNNPGATNPADLSEAQARAEKTAALKELAESRLSVLIGPAGTGKTTLLSILCQQEDIADGGVLLLAPTGKARVRMEQATKSLKLRGLTIAQFLSASGRYDGKAGRYRLSDEPGEPGAKTVIVDEASMLTEEMLGALLQALRGVTRLILIGDPRQLPPIGAGRPFVDIVRLLRPEGMDNRFPRLAPGYAELTVRRRQRAGGSGYGDDREDLQLADWFSGNPIPPGEDDVFDRVVRSGESDHVRFVQWTTPQEAQEKLIEVLVDELNLEGPTDAKRFDLSLGATEVNGYQYFNPSRGDQKGADAAVEAWQILSPVRALSYGVTEINRLIHRQFRSQMVAFAREKYAIPRPMGAEELVYGDKVINVRNHSRREVFPREEAPGYIANGEIGIATGQWKTPKMKGRPWCLKVAFSSQPGFQYDFLDRDFKEEGDATLELAYALTVHKAQG